MSTSHCVLAKASNSILVCIDVQTKLCPAMGNLQQVLKNGTRLLKGAKILDVPVLVTEQYPKGVGPTVGTFLIDLPPNSIIEKNTFSSVLAPAFLDRLKTHSQREQIILFGMETHVCVLQTALDLVREGWTVFVVKDAVSSRTQENESLGLQRMQAAGVNVVSTEMVLFEWLEGKDNPKFKEIHSLIV
ncbi:hydrolase [Phaeovibrio sulfidiphilus]|uniref:Hydrolase n=1 Tax=Phaeovibrio sulfidiphilus TaxID=1220600 RepID=A0A8J7CCY2_9PROT|nr:hydrolase [Phaeovibrio sulfidiphilus]MBE1236334.1 hydrolase [Phaeovibrio sulfidiphilus]